MSDRQEIKTLYHHHADSIADSAHRAAQHVNTAAIYFIEFQRPMANLIAAKSDLELALQLVDTLITTQKAINTEEES